MMMMKITFVKKRLISFVCLFTLNFDNDDTVELEEIEPFLLFNKLSGVSTDCVVNDSRFEPVVFISLLLLLSFKLKRRTGFFRIRLNEVRIDKNQRKTLT